MNKSDCCNADVGIGGNKNSVTRYHVCAKCLKACDIKKKRTTVKSFKDKLIKELKTMGAVHYNVAPLHKIYDEIIELIKQT